MKRGGGRSRDRLILRDALARGGIFRGAGGGTKSEALRELVDRMPILNASERGKFFEAVEARETLGSTGIGEGIALPHARAPVSLTGGLPYVTLALLTTPVKFGSPDQRPVHALFAVVSDAPSDRIALLARLGRVLRNRTMHQLLRDNASAGAILRYVAVAEDAGRP